MTSRGRKPTTITQYIYSAPQEARDKLHQMRACVRKAAPDATEGLKWGMPAFSHHRILVAFAGFRHHIGFYPTPSVVKAFTKQLAEFKTAKGSIQFRLDKPLPLSLIRKMTEFRVRESKEQDKKWRT